MLEEDAPSIEHVVPHSRGGQNKLENLLLAHKCCNEMRGNGKVCHAAREMWKQIAPQIATLRAAEKERRETPVAT